MSADGTFMQCFYSTALTTCDSSLAAKNPSIPNMALTTTAVWGKP